ncbi:tyrosine-type recombinase/integrase [Lysinibacillus endophyticus]|uniref:tyrosine-type recombinase/integrase n=1 Tax=Ureibacillus endophyticus TaxID=1978490 RepID=UPI0020A03E5F|nr:tyrosine-type recombinase/integrase [Lysinibacillus endophyticus]MCP1143669.1 tyrosine-type recombinase/integrase [Lysinibacillus endophyticus]
MVNQFSKPNFVRETLLVEAPTYNQGIVEFLKSLKYKQMSPQTIQGYAGDLKQFQKHLTGNSNAPAFVSSITEEKVESFKQSQIKKGLSAASVNRRINAVSSFCQFAVKKHWLPYNPARDVDRVKGQKPKRTFLSKREMQQLIANVKHPIIKYVVILMSNTGLRVSEAANLRIQDVDFEQNMVHVIQGKGGKNRDVPMSPALKKELQYYLYNVRPETTSINFFATKKTGGISQQYINRVIKETCQTLGFSKEVTSHALRHSFASNLVKTDTHVAVISNLLGHADVRTTSVYMHADMTDLQKAVNTIEFLESDGDKA